MAVIIKEKDNPTSTDLIEVILTSESEVSSLPTLTKPGLGKNSCFPGSVAYLPDLSRGWMLGPDDVWHRMF